jgi:AraC-like DNA-binding protein
LAICEVRRGIRLVFKPVDAVEVHYVLRGEMYFTVPGASVSVCGPGSVVIVPRGARQSVAADADPRQEYIASEHCSITRDGLLLHDVASGGPGDLRLVCGYVTANVCGSFGLLDRLAAPIVHNLSGTPVVGQIFAAMLDEASAPGLGSRAVLGALMKICLVRVLRSHVEQAGIQSMQLGYLSAPQLHKAVAAVLENPAAKLDVAALAETAGMGRSAFAGGFQAAFAMTPMEFVKRTRLHRAAELLRSTGISVKVIADKAGFASRSHFSRAFKVAYGTDPSAFRSQARASQTEAAASRFIAFDGFRRLGAASPRS